MMTLEQARKTLLQLTALGLFVWFPWGVRGI